MSENNFNNYNNNGYNNNGYNNSGGNSGNNGNNGKNNGNSNGNNNKKSNNNMLIICIVATLLTFLLFSFVSEKIKDSTRVEVTYSDFINMIEQDAVYSVKFTSTTIYITPKGKEK